MSWFREWLNDEGPERASNGGPESDERPDRSAARSRPVRAAAPDERRGTRDRDAAEPEADGWPGRRFGLPAEGPGSVVPMPRRAGQFLLDLLIGGLVASAIQFPAPTYLSLAVWALLVTVPVALIGQTPGMVLTGVRVARVDGAERVGWWAIARTVSLFFVLPAMVLDADGRGLQDRVSQTIAIRTR